MTETRRQATTLPRQASRLLLLCLLCPMLALAGCGSNDDKSTAKTGSEATPQAPRNEAVPVTNASDLDSKPKISRPTGDTPAALVIKDFVVGKGPAAKAGDTLSMQYVGVSFSNGRQFDASWDNGGEPIQIVLGQGQVIAGWDQGLVGMRVGGRRELVIPPELGYGAEGQPPNILPNETLVFVVDLVRIG